MEIGTTQSMNKIAEGLRPSALRTDTTNEVIIKIRNIADGENFSGMAYVISSQTRRNKANPNLFNITLHCIDGDGVPFSPTLFSAEEKEVVRNEVIYIKNGTKVRNSIYNKVFFNIEGFTKFKNYQVDISTFLKSINNLDNEFNKFKSYILSCQNPAIQKVIIELDKDKNTFNNLYKSYYKQEVGYKVGSPLLIGNTMIEAFNLIGENKDRDLFLLLVFTYLSEISYRNHSVLYRNSNFATDEFSAMEEIDASNFEYYKYTNILLGAVPDVELKKFCYMVDRILGSTIKYDKNSTLPIEDIFIATLKLAESKLRVQDTSKLQKFEKSICGLINM